MRKAGFPARLAQKYILYTDLDQPGAHPPGSSGVGSPMFEEKLL